MAKIAIVDDEKIILDMLNDFLSMKFEVETFSNPLVALERIKNGSYDLVLSDIMMPEMNGLELLKRLRSSNSDVKVIMMTAFDSMDKALEAHKYGAKNYIKKPFGSLKDIEQKIISELQEN